MGAKSEVVSLMADQIAWPEYCKWWMEFLLQAGETVPKSTQRAFDLMSSEIISHSRYKLSDMTSVIGTVTRSSLKFVPDLFGGEDWAVANILERLIEKADKECIDVA